MTTTKSTEFAHAMYHCDAFFSARCSLSPSNLLRAVSDAERSIEAMSRVASCEGFMAEAIVKHCAADASEALERAVTHATEIIDAAARLKPMLAEIEKHGGMRS